MVSKRQPRRNSWFPLALALLAGAFGPPACSRRAEIENAPDAGQVPVMQVPKPAGGVPLVEDAPLDHPEGLACNERPTQAACRGANDFGCDFDGWLQQLAEACQTQTDCHTDGWVEALLDSGGCTKELRMEDPDPEYVACLAEQLSRYRCPCPDALGSRFLGLSHDGCVGTPCGTGELRCRPGSTCQDGQCVDDATPVAGARG